MFRMHGTRLCSSAKAASCMVTAMRKPFSCASTQNRSYPTEPRVGVGVVVFRPPLASHHEVQPNVLLIQRAKEPHAGKWCLPGGSLELGETLAQCAAREVMEEAGIRLHCHPGAQGPSTLHTPTPFAAVDSIHRDAQGQLKFHYAIVEVAAVADEDSAEPRASDDASAARWVELQEIESMDRSGVLVPRCAEMVQLALQRFDVQATCRGMAELSGSSSSSSSSGNSNC